MAGARPLYTQISGSHSAMSEEHFDQWEHYNFQERLLTSRNTGRELSTGHYVESSRLFLFIFKLFIEMFICRKTKE